MINSLAGLTRAERMFIGRSGHAGMSIMLLMQRFNTTERIIKRCVTLHVAQSQAQSIAPSEPKGFTPLHLSILELKSTSCRRVFGEPGQYTFCGNPVEPKTSWCAHCSDIVFDRRSKLEAME